MSGGIALPSDLQATRNQMAAMNAMASQVHQQAAIACLATLIHNSATQEDIERFVDKSLKTADALLRGYGIAFKRNDPIKPKPEPLPPQD